MLVCDTDDDDDDEDDDRGGDDDDTVDEDGDDDDRDDDDYVRHDGDSYDDTDEFDDAQATQCYMSLSHPSPIPQPSTPIEIYLEKIRDLLDQHRLKTNLTIREDKVRLLTRTMTIFVIYAARIVMYWRRLMKIYRLSMSIFLVFTADSFQYCR